MNNQNLKPKKELYIYNVNREIYKYIKPGNYITTPRKYIKY